MMLLFVHGPDGSVKSLEFPDRAKAQAYVADHAVMHILDGGGRTDLYGRGFAYSIADSRDLQLS